VALPVIPGLALLTVDVAAQVDSAGSFPFSSPE